MKIRGHKGNEKKGVPDDRLTSGYRREWLNHLPLPSPLDGLTGYARWNGVHPLVTPIISLSPTYFILNQSSRPFFFSSGQKWIRIKNTGTKLSIRWHDKCFSFLHSISSGPFFALLPSWRRLWTLTYYIVFASFPSFSFLSPSFLPSNVFIQSSNHVLRRNLRYHALHAVHTSSHWTCYVLFLTLVSPSFPSPKGG